MKYVSTAFYQICQQCTWQLFIYTTKKYLLTIASLLVFSSYRVEDGDNVRWTVCKVGCAGNWRLMDVHGVRVLKNREAARYMTREVEKKVIMK